MEKDKSGLSLDFSIESAADRVNHLKTILQNPSSLSSRQIKLLQDYVLWGKDKDGKTGHQKHEFELKERGNHRTVASLEQILEQAVTNENRLSEVSMVVTPRRPARFSREKARVATKDFPELRRQFEELWERIDKEEFMVRIWKENYTTKGVTPDKVKNMTDDTNAAAASSGQQVVDGTHASTPASTPQVFHAALHVYDAALDSKSEPGQILAEFDVFGTNDADGADSTNGTNSASFSDTSSISISTSTSASSPSSRLTSSAPENFISTSTQTQQNKEKSGAILIEFRDILAAQKEAPTHTNKPPVKPPDENSKPQFVFSNFDGIKIPSTPYFNELRGRIPKEKQPALIEKALNWSQRAYLQHRTQLIDMREEQYTLQDSIMPTMGTNHSEKTVMPYVEPPVMFGEEIPVLPLGLINASPLATAIFKDREHLNPETITTSTWVKVQEFLKAQNTIREKIEKNPKLPHFNFENEEHVYQMFRHWSELNTAVELRQEAPSLLRMESTLHQFLATISFYSNFQDLTDSQRELLRLKLEGYSNYQVMVAINKKFGKSYSENYISTIFKKRVIRRVCAAAAFHKTIVERLSDDEAWKKCSSCQALLLLDERNFNKNVRTATGFQYRCRFCQRAARQKRR